MAMSLKERMQKWKLLRRNYTSCNQPSPGNIAIFFDEHHSMAYAGVVIKWPLIMWADSESGIAVGLDWWQLEKHRAAWKSEGYFVISTDSIKEAISYFKDADFDMVLLGQFINHKDKERLTSLIRSTGAQAPVVCIADSSGSSASFADVTLMDESGALLTGMKELLANKAKLRAASAVSYGTAI